MRSWVSPIFLTATVWMTLAFLSSSQALEANPAKETTIVFATGEYPPFVSEKMKGQGLTAQFLRAVLKKAGYEVRFDFYPWPRIEYLARDGKIAASMPWGKTTERDQYFIYSQQPIIVSRRAVFYRKSRFSLVPFNSVDDLKKMHLAAVQSYWYIPEFKKNRIRYTEVNTPKKGWMLLENNRVDALVENYQVGLHDVMLYAPDLKKDLAYTKDPSISPQFVAYAKANPESMEIKKIVDGALAGFLKDQSLDDFYDNPAKLSP